MITDPACVVAKLHYPMRITGLTKVMSGLAKLYGDDLVIITDGPLFEHGWMIVAQPDLTKT